MLKVAITGNIGSGKSTVCKIFESLDIPVFYADTEAKKLYDLPEVKSRVQQTFGAGLFDENGRLIKPKLAGMVFENPEALAKLNAIIHPELMEVYKKWLSGNRHKPYTLHEAAVIFENGLENEFDFIINVSCPEAIRLERIKNRDKLPEKEIRKRMSRQWPDEEKNKRSQAVIINDGKHFLIPQVLDIHKQILEKIN
ncbi:dephospho-CoA kinase [Candidatus Sulfidibacterium hydrothermale]|uniref:dephospho-CoA kinase n=1 Tax=Candidatus Sulfidibacterium hydrothermale TaxID=2875962 RepID=UPI001F0AC32E|nr:dephospho-CoA kinase [Candidatus Sulfidibacterium hydrothermale]UBM61300.1 dephospho-CoA kinase [Candidatus Sulfidibacterium hydrothermale]